MKRAMRDNLTQTHDYRWRVPCLPTRQASDNLKTNYIQMKNIGIVLVAVGLLMIIYTGFTYVTKEKVVDLGPIEINAEKDHPVQWSPIVGVVLLVGGIVLILIPKAKA